MITVKATSNMPNPGFGEIAKFKVSSVSETPGSRKSRGETINVTFVTLNKGKEAVCRTDDAALSYLRLKGEGGKSLGQVLTERKLKEAKISLAGFNFWSALTSPLRTITTTQGEQSLHDAWVDANLDDLIEKA